MELDWINWGTISLRLFCLGFLVFVIKCLPWFAQNIAHSRTISKAVRGAKIENSMFAGLIGAILGFCSATAFVGLTGITFLSGWLFPLSALAGAIWAVRICLKTISQTERIFG